MGAEGLQGLGPLGLSWGLAGLPQAAGWLERMSGRVCLVLVSACPCFLLGGRGLSSASASGLGHGAGEEAEDPWCLPRLSSAQGLALLLTLQAVAAGPWHHPSCPVPIPHLSPLPLAFSPEAAAEAEHSEQQGQGQEGAAVQLQGPQAGTARARARLLHAPDRHRQPGRAPGGTAESSGRAGEQRGHAEPQEQGEPRAEHGTAAPAGSCPLWA